MVKIGAFRAFILNVAHLFQCENSPDNPRVIFLYTYDAATKILWKIQDEGADRGGLFDLCP